MPRARDLLNRFRPSGTPGAAGAAGVPVDRTGGAAAELAPLFAALEPTERECQALLDRAADDARRIRGQAEEEAQRLVVEARERQSAERAAVVAELRDHRAARGAATAAEAQRRAAQVRELSAARTAGCVDDVVAAVRALAGEGG
ncbi:hypothetical protein GCM10009844_40690 [Nocardioides koreensis]|uniref:ATPase n=1 Tax=Nocardioides koreensis TaxID=433651 RepID=A0ABP5LV77_9ACTN